MLIGTEILHLHLHLHPGCSFLVGSTVRYLFYSTLLCFTALTLFLILEAKEEAKGPGFEAIETQTAFPIRTCLKLQQDLGNRSEEHVNLDPLVLFLSNEGDEWRVAGCVSDNGEYVSHPETQSRLSSQPC